METNKKLIGVFIKATPENRQELKEFWEANSEDAIKKDDDYEGAYYYGLGEELKMDFFVKDYVLQNGYKILTLPEAKALISESPYPKVMWVWDRGNENAACKRVVFMKKNGKYLAWRGATTIEEAEKETSSLTWGFAKDIEHEEQPLPEIHLTMEQIAELANCKVEQLKISK